MYLLDMDGVLVDFTGGVAEYFNVKRDTLLDWKLWEALDLTEAEMWDEIDKLGPGFWSTLKPYPWTDELIKFLGEDNIVVSTAPSRAVSSITGKAIWIKARFGKSFTRFMIGNQKHLMAGSSCILIDDRDKNVKKFREAGGKAILFPQPWNKNKDILEDKVEFVRREIDAIISTGEPWQRPEIRAYRRVFQKAYPPTSHMES